MLDRTALRHADQGQPALLTFLQGMGRLRSNDINLQDETGRVLCTSPASPYKTGRDAPAWFARWVEPPQAVTTIPLPPLPSDSALTVYRAAQEGLANALRHGRATRLHLTLPRWIPTQLGTQLKAQLKTQATMACAG